MTEAERWMVADWTEALEAALNKPGLSNVSQKALRCWAIKEIRIGKCLDFTPHQLAVEGGCNVRTIYRDLPFLQQANLIEQLVPGNRGTRKAALFRLTLDMPDWSDFS